MFLQAVLPDPVDSIVTNSGSGWAVLAFVAGAAWFRSPVWVVALAGTLLELGLVVGYYGSVIIRYDQDPPSFWAYVWAAVALVAGPVFGVAGAWWRGPVAWRRIAGLALLGGLFVAEGVLRATTLPDKPAGWIMVALGLVFPLALGHGGREKLYSLLGVVPAVGLALAVLAALQTLSA
jgi:hypothetical protein